MAFLIPTTGHTISGVSDITLHRLMGAAVTLIRTAEVHDRYVPCEGVHIAVDSTVIGWVPKQFWLNYKDRFENNFGLREIGDTCAAQVDDFYMQDTGKLGLRLKYCDRQPPPKNKSTPQTPKADEEQSKMKLPTLQEMLTTNTAAVTTAAQLETGRVASKQLAKIVGKKLKPEHAALLETPIGQAVLANGVILLGKSLYPDNDLLKKVSNAMLVSSLQELLQSFDIPGIIGELLDDKSVLKAALKEKDGE